MKKLTQIIAYLLDNYPNKQELSNARVTKMVYLADWRNALINKRQLSGISWYFDNHGPFVWDIYNEVAENSEIFSIKEDKNFYGKAKRLFSLDKKIDFDLLNEKDKSVLDKIIESTKSLTWNQFIQLVYSTYPIVSTERYTSLDLTAKAEDFYKKKAVQSFASSCSPES